MICRTLIFLAATFGLGYAQNCNETNQSALVIEFNVTEEEFSSFSLNLRFASNQSTIRFDNYTSFGKVPSNVTECISKDECIELSITKLDQEQYNIQKDGQVVTPGPSFPSLPDNSTFSTTELGSCIPACGEGEVLFNLEVFTGARDGDDLDWRLEDVIEMEIMATCDKRINEKNESECDYQAWNLYHSRRCLPFDRCYRMIVGDERWSAIDEESEQPQFNVTVDNERVAEFQGFRFDSVDFGDACSASCNEDEALLEFFLWRAVFFDTYPDISWSFMDGETSVLDGTITWNDTVLQHVRDCVPSDACISFEMSVPEMRTILLGKENATYYETDPYRLSLDGVLFVDGRYQFGGKDGKPRQFSETTAVGQCTVADLCDSETESLFDLQLETGGDSHFDITWLVDYVHKGSRDPTDALVGSDPTNNGLHRDTAYRTYECIPNMASCLEFVVPEYDIDEGEAFKFTVSINGNIVDGRDCLDSSCTGQEDIVIPLGDDECPDVAGSGGLSNGVIVGIAVGGMVGLALLY